MFAGYGMQLTGLAPYQLNTTNDTRDFFIRLPTPAHPCPSIRYPKSHPPPGSKQQRNLRLFSRSSHSGPSIYQHLAADRSVPFCC
jgi:hypothetical protein